MLKNLAALNVGALVLNIGVFFLWVTTQSNDWVLVGVFVLSLFAVVSGSSILFVLYDVARYRNFARIRIPVAVMVVCMLIVVVGLCVGVRIFECIEVVVKNNSSILVSDIVLEDAVHRDSFGDLLPLTSTRFCFYPKAEGALQMTFIVRGVEKTIVVSGYMSTNGLSDSVVVISPSGEVSIEHLNRKRMN